MVAFSSVNFLSLASVAHNKYPVYQLIIAADRDLNGSGQNRAETAAKACQCDIVLPPVLVTGMMRLPNTERNPPGRQFLRL